MAYAAAAKAAGTRVLQSAVSQFDAGTDKLLLNGHRTIDLVDKRLTDVDVATLAVALTETKKFKVVDLSYNELGAGAAMSLSQVVKSNTVITALDLSENGINAHAVEGLCAALKTNGTIRELSLSGNAIGGSGGMAVAELLQVNTTLERLSLANCNLTTESLVALATVLHENVTLRALDVSRPLARTIMDEPASHVARMLKVNSSLVELDLSKAGVRDFGLRLIAENLFRAGASSALAALRLRCNKIELTDADCVLALRSLLMYEEGRPCRLELLDLGGNQLRDDGAEKLAEMLNVNASLRSVDVGSNGLMSRGLCAIAHNVMRHPKLVELKLWGNHFDTAAGYKFQSFRGSLDFVVQQVDGVYHCVDAR
jgi:Ran GTPase-activating protein (RanGAP) involved in mRNA processing and transport